MPRTHSHRPHVRITTPGAAVTPVVSLDPAVIRPEGITGDYQGFTEARIVARSATGSAFLRKGANIRRIGGTLSRVGSVLDLVTPAVDLALTGILADISVSGTNVQVTVTGLAATSITWDVDIETRIYHA